MIGNTNNSSSGSAGVDEAGRGPLAGPVVAAAVILPPRHGISGINDSKKLSPRARSVLSAQIKTHASCWSIASATPAEIDHLNILQATMVAMARALEGLSVQPATAFIDGNRCPELAPHLNIALTAVVGGDRSHETIAAASILAKVHRDELMIRYHSQYPEYGFDQHKGYPTARHIAALVKYGPVAIHRRSFRPVADNLRVPDPQGIGG
ncbi:MAG: ribonuclease HII [Gammaproteobacteria bacterium]|nr:ribonuclease HII [Gammaproteobacteria bacterium]